MIQEEQLASDFTSVINDTDIAETKDFDEKIKEDIDKLISLLQKSSQPTLGNKIAASCTAIGLGGIIGGLTGATCRLSQKKTYILPCSGGLVLPDMSDFLSSSSIVGIPVGLVAAGLSFLILKKIIKPKNNSVLNAFSENLNRFKTALSKNQMLSQDDQTKLEKIISLTSTIFEKNSPTSKATILKKLFLILIGGLAVSYSSGIHSENLLSELWRMLEIGGGVRFIPKTQADIFFFTQIFSFLLAGTGFVALITNKLFDAESVNLELLQAAITRELHEFLPSEIALAD